MFEFLASYTDSDENFDNLMNSKSPVREFIERINNFAFYNELNDACLQNDGCTTVQAIENKKAKVLVSNLMTEKGLGYGNLPKGVLLFHSYSTGARTAYEEHLEEGAKYGKSNGNEVNLIFTVSNEHLDLFKNLHNKVCAKYENQFGVKYHVMFTEQMPSTDTVAVDMNNQPFRNNDGSLLFRPGGHGALISNLNQIDADVIFIKNIDNIVNNRLIGDTVTYKIALAGYMLEKQNQMFDYIKKLNENCTDELIEEVSEFANTVLCISFTDEYIKQPTEAKKEFLLKKLHRPLRVCGMVKNDGDTGGGPFWAVNQDGTSSLQVVETAQINLKDENKKNIFMASTHFNPVDLICGIKDYQGNKFDLHQFVDENTGFISQKSKDGRDLKALELPGLWNGSMSDWNTIFVEAPLITFNPVKTINDLLLTNHQ